MSVNYYFKDVKAKESQKQLEEALNILKNVDLLFIGKLNFPTSEDIFGIYEAETLHIGQSAYGTLLLKRNEHFYTTVAEMKKFYEKNKDRLSIVAEHGIEYTWDEFEKEVLSEPARTGNGIFSDKIIRDKDGYVWATYDFY
ncbi:hypothetical protein ACFVS2_25860 [Brevibacillus sp. NPDC058079]|uniref:hypothetical protein n=1 Tax=Brevibacillus sp. NPDC058079 TaxID=3346330 RepID=UPI0036E7219E